MVETRTLGRYDTTPRRSAARDTLLLGLIGAGTVALWFLIVDVVKDQIWFTPAALGSALFLGARGIAEVRIDALTIIGYTLVHIAAFTALAWVTVRLMRAAEREPRAWLGLILLFVVLEVFTLGMLAIMAAWLLEALSMWTVAIANVLAGVAMGAYLLSAYPMMREDLRVNVEEVQ